MARRLTWAMLVLAAIAVASLSVFAWNGPTASAKPSPVYTVNTTADNQTTDGQCTLREAIILTDVTFANFSNDCGGAVAVQVTINFNVGSGTPTIAIDHAQGPLPPITRSVVINGNTGGADRIEIAGGGVSGSGLYFSGANASGSAVYRMVINGFPSYAGIRINAAPSVSVMGNFIGTNSTGTLAIANKWGISSNPPNGLKIGSSNGTTPGGPCTGDCNLISGNVDKGVDYFGGSQSDVEPLIQGNFIGTDVEGTSAIPNGIGIHASGGPSLIGGSFPGEGNVISGNQTDNIDVSADGTLIRRNFIGTAADGSSRLGHTDFGIFVTHSADVSIGGPNDGNVIAYHAYAGVFTHDSPNVAVNQNSIFGNGRGIDTPYDSFPTISDANPITGTACPNCTVEVFSDQGGQGRIYEGTTQSDGGGNWTFSGAVTGPGVTATWTQFSTGHYSTSEFSGPFLLPATPTPTSSSNPTLTPTPTGSVFPTDTPNGSTTPTPTPTSTPTQTPHPSQTPTHTPTVERVEGDLDCDGHINFVDFDLLLEFVGQLNNGLTPGICPDLYELFQGQRWGDFDCDGFLTARDSLYLLEYEAELATLPSPGAGCPPIGTQLA